MITMLPIISPQDHQLLNEYKKHYLLSKINIKKYLTLESQAHHNLRLMKNIVY